MRAWLPTLSLALIGGCAAIADPAGPQEVAGLYSAGFEVESFRPCGSEESWWVAEAQELRTRYGTVAREPYEPVYVVVRARVGPAGRFGHMAAYTREIEVAEVVQMRAGACP